LRTTKEVGTKNKREGPPLRQRQSEQPFIIKTPLRLNRITPTTVIEEGAITLIREET
jgi:hypothetical protein